MLTHPTLDQLTTLKLTGMHKVLCDWIKKANNILITGATGTGKSYIACTLAHKACLEGDTVSPQGGRFRSEWVAGCVGIRSLFFLLMNCDADNFFSAGWTYHASMKLKCFSRPAVVNVLIRQLYFTGVQSLPWVLLMSLFAGVTAVYSVVPFAKQLDDLSLIGSMVNSLLVQEMAPLLITIFLLTRSGVAVVTEISNMHVRGEDMLLRSMGIDLHEYLHVPRIFAFALCGLILTVLFVGISIWLGGLIVALNHEMNFTRFWSEISKGTTLNGILMMALKGAGYPLLCCGMLLFQGCKAGHNPNHTPIRATNGVLGSLMMVVMMDVSIRVLKDFL